MRSFEVQKSFIKRNKKKIILIFTILEIASISVLALSPSSSQQDWLAHYPETITFIPFDYRDATAQIQYIKLDSNVVIGGEPSRLEIRIWQHEQNQDYITLKIRVRNTDFPYNIQFDNGDGKYDWITTTLPPQGTSDVKFKVYADCDGCRNTTGFIIDLLDTEGNLLQTQTMMIRIYNYETSIEEWYWNVQNWGRNI